MDGAIDTPRLTLRRLTPDDAPFILQLLNEPSFVQNIGDRHVRSVPDAIAYINKGPIASYQRHGFGLLLVSLRDPAATPIGICGLLKRDTLQHPDLGFALLPAFWGQGYAGEAAGAVLDFARDVLVATTLAAIVDPRNGRSIHLLQKLGFVRRGTVRMASDGTALDLMERSAERG